MSDRPRPGERRDRRGRLSRSAEFDRVYRQGRSQGNRFLVLYAFPRDLATSETPRASNIEALPVTDIGSGEGSESVPELDVDQAAGRNEEPASQRLGVSVSRKVGGSVERNKVKRLLREAFWAEAGGVPDDHDFVVVARPDVGSLAEREGLAGVQRELRELVMKLNPRANAESGAAQPGSGAAAGVADATQSEAGG
jgi:ribonuclease P protein component